MLVNNEIEIWKQLPNNPKYQISDLGRAKRDNEIIPIRQDTSRNFINCPGKHNMNELVATLFVLNDDPINKTKIVNIDGNKFNNKAINLRWEPEPLKKNRIYKTDMSKPIIQYDIEGNFIKEWKNIDSIAQKHNYVTGHIYKCLNGRIAQAYGSVWKYKDFEYEKIVYELDEEFKTIGTFEEIDCSKYEISNYGKVRHAKSRFLLKHHKNTTYDIVHLYIKKKIHIFQVHKMVAQVFVPKETDKHNIVIHKDDNPMNNDHKNLKYVTKKGYAANETSKSSMRDEIEIWLPVRNNDEYLVSTLGRMKSLYTGKLLISNHHDQYDAINLVPKDGTKQRKWRIHRIVADTFSYNPNPLKNNIIDHIDNNKRNNKSENLRWVTYAENSQNYHQYFKEPMHKPIIQYDKNMNIIKEWYNLQQLCEEMKYSESNIRSCIHEKYHFAYGFVWRYKNASDYEKYSPELKEDEIFMNIEMFEDKDFSDYEISNYGNVKSLVSDIYVKFTESNGYCIVSLTDKIDKTRYQLRVHRLVADKFNQNRTEENNIVNHLDGNRSNNKPYNLEWTTIRGNNIHARGIKVHQICLTTGTILNTFESVGSARHALNLKSDISIHRCLQGLYSHGYGYKWTYA